MARLPRQGASGSDPQTPSPLSVESADGCPVATMDEAKGTVTVIISGGGLDDGRGYARLAAKMTTTCRVLRLTRRQYLADVERWRPVDITDEASDIVAVARAAGRPCYLFGHSAGAVAALEAAIAAPEWFEAIAVYEPAIELDELPLGPPNSTVAARKAIKAGHPGRALEIFLRDMVGAPPAAAKLARLAALSPRFRSQLIPGQIGDQEALERLGDRLAQYRAIEQHVLLIGGSKSPEHFGRRIEFLDHVLPNSDIRRMTGAGHAGPTRKPSDLAQAAPRRHRHPRSGIGTGDAKRPTLALGLNAGSRHGQPNDVPIHQRHT